jgi:hypothetical protein
MFNYIYPSYIVNKVSDLLTPEPIYPEDLPEQARKELEERTNNKITHDSYQQCEDKINAMSATKRDLLDQRNKLALAREQKSVLKQLIHTVEEKITGKKTYMWYLAYGGTLLTGIYASLKIYTYMTSSHTQDLTTEDIFIAIDQLENQKQNMECELSDQKKQLTNATDEETQNTLEDGINQIQHKIAQKEHEKKQLEQYLITLQEKNMDTGNSSKFGLGKTMVSAGGAVLAHKAYNQLFNYVHTLDMTEAEKTGFHNQKKTYYQQLFRIKRQLKNINETLMHGSEKLNNQQSELLSFAYELQQKTGITIFNEHGQLTFDELEQLAHSYQELNKLDYELRKERADTIQNQSIESLLHGMQQK